MLKFAVPFALVVAGQLACGSVNTVSFQISLNYGAPQAAIGDSACTKPLFNLVASATRNNPPITLTGSGDRITSPLFGAYDPATGQFAIDVPHASIRTTFSGTVGRQVGVAKVAQLAPDGSELCSVVFDADYGLPNQ